MKDEEKTVVIFRKWTKAVYGNGEIIALFPYEDGGEGYCGSYMHIGQHGGASYHYVISSSVPATAAEYKLLKAELEDLGYNLDIKRKLTHTRRRA
jgi:hypothetical protein